MMVRDYFAGEVLWKNIAIFKVMFDVTKYKAKGRILKMFSHILHLLQTEYISVQFQDNVDQ